LYTISEVPFHIDGQDQSIALYTLLLDGNIDQTLVRHSWIQYADYWIVK